MLLRIAGHPVKMLKNHDQERIDMCETIEAVEKILDYNFKDKNLLEMALTHSSYTNSPSYQRLEFLGDAALGCVIARYAYLAYPVNDPQILLLVKAANISTERLARVAVRSGLYKYLRHNASSLDDQIKEFLEVVREEQNTVVYGGAMKAPKVLADIVESVVAAVHVDLQYDLKATWLVVQGLLEPFITINMLPQHPQPVSMLFELCQKNGQQVDIKHWRQDDKNVASVYIDSKLIVSVSSDQCVNVKLHAARAALEKLAHQSGKIDTCSSVNETYEIESAKRKLHEVCSKKKWPIPSYRIEKQVGPAHARIFVCSVSLKVADDLIYKEGDEKSRLRDAEGSAASAMLLGLQEKNYI